MTDAELLRQFVQHGSQPAFAELVRRHVDWVHSAALRRVHDPHLAEDVTQAVFLVLAQKARSIDAKKVVSAWLFHVVAHVSAQVQRREARRKRHEALAVVEGIQRMSDDPMPDIAMRDEWARIVHVLDDVVGRLRSGDRDAVLLRFYEQKSFAEVGNALGITEEAARKRVSRATEKLRGMLAGKGMNLPATALAGLLLAEVSKPTPGVLAASIAAIPVGTLVGAAGAAAGAGTAAALANGAMAIMAWSQAKITAGIVAVSLLLVGGGTGVVLQVMQQREAAGNAAATTQVAEEIPEETHLRWTGDVPKTWYIMRQPDYMGILLHGMPQRLGKFALASQQSGPVWDGIESGGQLKLRVEVDDDAKGEIYVGFFSDAKWSAEPVQVRKLPGPGEYEVQNLIPGKFSLGAMIATAERPVAIGVDSTWPTPVEMTSGQSSTATLRVSKRNAVIPTHQPQLFPGWPGNRRDLNPANLVTIHVADAQGKPVPFARVTISAWQKSHERDGVFLNAGTDERGNAYLDRLEGRNFSITVQRYESEPELLTERYQYMRLAQIYVGQGALVIPVQLKPVPAASATVSGYVRDQFGRPLREFYLTLEQQSGLRQGADDYSSMSYHLPFVSPDGSYEVRGVAPGDYEVRVRAFDYATHVGGFDQLYKLSIPVEPSAHVRFDVPVEARMLYFGRALYADGSPVSPGSWTAILAPQTRDWTPSSYRSFNIEPDGQFRVALSRTELAAVTATSQGRIRVNGGSELLGEIKLSDLGKSRKDPPVFFFTRPTTQPTSSER